MFQYNSKCSIGLCNLNENVFNWLVISLSSFVFDVFILYI